MLISPKETPRVATVNERLHPVMAARVMSSWARGQARGVIEITSGRSQVDFIRQIEAGAVQFTAAQYRSGGNNRNSPRQLAGWRARPSRTMVPLAESMGGRLWRAKVVPEYCPGAIRTALERQAVQVAIVPQNQIGGHDRIDAR